MTTTAEDIIQHIDRMASKLASLRHFVQNNPALQQLTDNNPSTQFLFSTRGPTIYLHRVPNAQDVCRSLGGQWKRKVGSSGYYNYEGVLPCGTEITIFDAEVIRPAEPLIL